MLVNDIIFYLYIFFVSACFGSFINVVIDRIISGKKMTMTERSHCCNCGHILSFLDLIFVLKHWRGSLSVGDCARSGAEE